MSDKPDDSARVPTLDDLLKRLQSKTAGIDSLRKLYVRVAAGKRHPITPPLPSNAVLFACQAMAILFNHVDNVSK